MIKLKRKAGLAEGKDLTDNINKISKECQICRLYKRPSKSVVNAPLVTEFNEVVAMDIKVFRNIFTSTQRSRFSAATIRKSTKKEILKNIFKIRLVFTDLLQNISVTM